MKRGCRGVPFRISLKAAEISALVVPRKPEVSSSLRFAPLRSAPLRTALRRLAPTRRENNTTVHVDLFICLLQSPGAFHPPDLFAHALSRTSAFSLRLMPLRLKVGATPILPRTRTPRASRCV